METVDCTADPHYVNFESLQYMYETILRVCSNPVVWAITSVRLKLNGEKYMSDTYFAPILPEDHEKVLTSSHS